MQLQTTPASVTMIAAATLFSVAIAEPASALSGKFSINLNSQINSVLTTGIDFNQSLVAFGFNSKSGDFSSYTAAYVQDLTFPNPLVNGPNSDITFTPGIASFIRLEGGSLGTITFDLQQLTNVFFNQGNDGPKSNGIFYASMKGTFQPSDKPNSSSIDAIASFRLGQGGNGGAIELTVEPIPTPALLPGLVAMGLAAYRKRQATDPVSKA